MNWDDLSGRLMHQYGWLPSQVRGMPLDDFLFAVEHTGRLNEEAAKAFQR